MKVILLDGRYFREEPAHWWNPLWRNAEPTADILGAEQWAWLEHELATSTADINLIGSGIQVIANEHPFEKWDELPQARARFFDLIAKTKPRNLIILSGDRHLGEISRAVDPRILDADLRHHLQRHDASRHQRLPPQLRPRSRTASESGKITSR